LGTKVSIVQRGNYLVPHEDEEIAAKFTQLMASRYTVYTGFEPAEVARSGDVYRVKIASRAGGEARELESDQLLVATGRMPNSDLLDLEKTGIRTDERGYIAVDEYLETTQKGIFALGDAIGRYQFKHTANHEAVHAYNNLMQRGERTPVDYTAMPHAIFTQPQIAGVGKTERQLVSENVPYWVGRWSYLDTAMGRAIEDSEGFVKFLVRSDTLQILGCHIMGSDASSLIHEVLVAMKSGDGTINSITNVVHIHPALPEVVIRAAENLYDPTHHHHEDHLYR